MEIFSPKPGSSRKVSKAAFSILMLGLATSAFAEDFPFQKSTDAEFEKGFAEDKGLTQADKDVAAEDRLKLGGTLWTEFQYLHFGETSPVDSLFKNPNTLWLYLDARLKNDVRGVVKAKMIYDPTATGTIDPFTNAKTKDMISDLEEMKILFSVGKKVFFTVGKQKIKWGSGQFWNPTDFLNSKPRDFFYTTDLRSGIPQIKTHVPIGASNLYLIQGLEGASEVKKIRHSVRFEVPVQTAEFSATASYRDGGKARMGLDFSTALGNIDAYGELAYSPGNEKTFYSSTGSFLDPDREQLDWVLGANYQMPYSDTDTVIFGLECFHNGLGYAKTSDYADVVSGGGYEFSRLSKDYGMFMIQLVNPGSWNHVTFTLFNILNVTDSSVVTRLDSVFSFMDDLSMGLAAGVHYGKKDGEFRYGGQAFDLSGRLMIDF